MKAARWVSPWSFEHDWEPVRTQESTARPTTDAPHKKAELRTMQSAFEQRVTPLARPTSTTEIAAKSVGSEAELVSPVVTSLIKSFADYGDFTERREETLSERVPAPATAAPALDDARFRPPPAGAVPVAEKSPPRLAAVAPMQEVKAGTEKVEQLPIRRQAPVPNSIMRREKADRSWTTPIILCLGMLGFVLIAWIYLTDVLPESDEDLRVPVPVDQAPRIAAPERMKVFLGAVVRLENTVLTRTPAWEWDTPSLSSFVSANATAFDNLRDLLEDFDWHPHHAAWHAEDLGEHESWPFVRILLQAHAAYMIRRGDEGSALTTAIDIAELSRRMQELWAWPSFMHRSQEMHMACVQTLADILKQTRLSSAVLRRFQDEFIRCEPADASLQGGLNAFYVHEKKLLLGEKSGVPLDTLPAGVTQERPARLFFKKQETLSLFADAFRQLRDEAVVAPYAALGQAGQSMQHARKKAALYFQPNGAGERYFSQHIESYLALPERHSLGKTRHALVLSLFAIRRYLADHQKLPSGLSELRPGYLLDMPMDPYTGEPLNYDPLTGVIFSAGTNYRKEGGKVTQPPLLDPTEPTVELGIAIAAPVMPGK